MNENINRIPVKGIEDRDVPFKQIAIWVGRNIGIDCLVDLSSSPPCREAVCLLNWVNSSPDNEREFWTKIWCRNIPTRGKDDDDNGFADDGRANIELIDRIKRAQA